MKYCISKFIKTFMCIVLAVSMLVNCMLVGAEGLANTGGVPYNEDKGQFILDGTIPTAPAPEVTMGIVVEEDVPPTPEYDLTLDWGPLALKYTFNTDGKDDSGNPILTGGSWGESFDGINNQIKITNNNTSRDIVYGMVYLGIYDSSNPMYSYSQGIMLSNIYDPTNAENPYGTVQGGNLSYAHMDILYHSGNLEGKSNYAILYIYDINDIYANVNSGEMPAPTESIADIEVGMVTVEAFYVT